MISGLKKIVYYFIKIFISRCETKEDVWSYATLALDFKRSEGEAQRSDSAKKFL